MIWELTYLQYGNICDPYEQARVFFGTKKKALAHKKYLIKTADSPDDFIDFRLYRHNYNKTNEGVAHLCNYISDGYV